MDLNGSAKLRKKTRFRSMCFIDQSRLRRAGTRAGASGPLPFTAPAHKSFLDRTGVGAHLRCLRITLKGTTLRKNRNKKHVSKACVLSIKVALNSVARRRERRDLHVDLIFTVNNFARDPGGGEAYIYL